MSDASEFRPEITSRRGEFFAWVAALGMGVVLILAQMNWGSVAAFMWIFAGLLFFSAASISLGNWMDRRSIIRLLPDGIAFENGLRSVTLGWPEVRNVTVARARLGKRVEVVGEASHFAFKLLNETTMNGQVFRTGFAAGQMILDTVLKSSGLQLKSEAEGTAYYARA
jgi:hypothetical protein